MLLACAAEKEPVRHIDKSHDKSDNNEGAQKQKDADAEGNLLP